MERVGNNTWKSTGWSGYLNTREGLIWTIPKEAQNAQIRLQCQAIDVYENDDGDTVSRDVTINYYWQDADNKRVLYMGETQVVKEVDIGRTICCQVHVVDNQTSENFTVVSNSVGPVNRPVLPEFDVWVDGELHEDPTADVGIEPNGTVVIEVRQMPVSNAPADLTYEWKIRNGTGRLSGDLDGTGIIYLAPDTAPAGALVTCLANSLDANDSAYAAEVPILVSE